MIERKRTVKQPLWLADVMTLSAALASVLVVPLGIWESIGNPFIGDFDLVDFLIMFVGGSMGAFLWFVWALAVVHAVVRGWWHPIALLFLVFAVFFGYLYFGTAQEYSQDRVMWANIQKQSAEAHVGVLIQSQPESQVD